MAKDKGSGGCGSAGFILLLIALSALAIWFAEEERPRQEVAGLTATVSVRRATAQARRTATAVALDSRVRQTATAHARTVTARARQMAAARWTVTARARRTSVAQINRARSTATARARQTAAARTWQTATAQAPRTATIRSWRTEMAVAQTSRARRTATALYQRTATERVRRTSMAVRFATVRARQTATALARANTIPTATVTPAITQYRVNYEDGRVNIRDCPSLSCVVIHQFNYGTELDGLRIVEGELVSGESRWLEFLYQGQVLYVHISLVESLRIEWETVTPQDNTPVIRLKLEDRDNLVGLTYLKVDAASSFIILAEKLEVFVLTSDGTFSFFNLSEMDDGFRYLCCDGPELDGVQRRNVLAITAEVEKVGAFQCERASGSAENQEPDKDLYYCYEN